MPCALELFFLNIMPATINYEISDMTIILKMIQIQICGSSTIKALIYVAVVSTD